ncbi:MAG: hypothetical protein U0872_15985 [Planctomycetaceae bacterium]
MSKQFWRLWLVPFVAWGVYMCWLSGYEAGLTAGNDQAWDSFHQMRTWDDALREDQLTSTAGRLTKVSLAR